MEICYSVKTIKYICKYMNKDSDQAALTLENERYEVKLHDTDCYISSLETVKRILAFPLH